ncbi:hypothetical protein [Saccharopolyspora endophytica]|uniref:Uncharacterized protein n=1 Tax=Saccharopolyspora endophytica TaxID=543886 RepID=A0ABS5DJS0_9PSEU|nr:hypothetical protein [Saccharopolyspora endophytica]MBQ0926534.1 hypothetical protein [Saccharopolyspora endophytica]
MPQDVLGRLLFAAQQDLAADQVWPAAAAAIEVLWWHDRFSDAQSLAEDTISRFGSAPGTLFDHDMPFDEAILIGATESGEDPRAVLGRVGEHVPADSTLGKRLTWLQGELAKEQPAHSLITGFDADLYSPLPARPLRGADAELAERDPDSLSGSEQRRLWGASRRSRQPHIAFTLHDAGVEPQDWQMSFWLARQLIKASRVEEAGAVLLTSLDLWFAEQPWHVTPAGITTQPDMRAAVTPELRGAVLDQIDLEAVPGVE